MTNRKPIDALFISHYEDVDKWHNDHLAPEGAEGGVTGPRPSDTTEVDDPTTHSRMLRQAVRIDGHFVDQARLLSKLRFGTTAEFRRYDSFAFTHLSGSYYRCCSSATATKSNTRNKPIAFRSNAWRAKSNRATC